jgi:hypothetical protein
MESHPLRIFCGSAHPQFANEITGILSTTTGISFL